jgi:TonB family protein
MNVFEHADLWSDYEDDARPRVRVPLPVASAANEPHAWRYQIPGGRRGGRLILAIGVAGGLHALALLGFNTKAPTVVVAPPDQPLIELSLVADVAKLEEPELVDASEPGEAAPADAGYVPMLADIPMTVDVSTAFVQQMDFSSLQPKTDLSAAKVVSIPSSIRRGGGTGQGLKEIFSLAQLDRIPEALFQPPPVFPAALRKDVETARVEVEFVVTAKGEVTDVQVVSATFPGFENASIAGVSRWQFRPGMKAGKKVNTRMRVPLIFRVIDNS